MLVNHYQAEHDSYNKLLMKLLFQYVRHSHSSTHTVACTAAGRSPNLKNLRYI